MHIVQHITILFIMQSVNKYFGCSCTNAFCFIWKFQPYEAPFCCWNSRWLSDIASSRLDGRWAKISNFNWLSISIIVVASSNIIKYDNIYRDSTKPLHSLPVTGFKLYNMLKYVMSWLWISALENPPELTLQFC